MNKPKYFLLSPFCLVMGQLHLYESSQLLALIFIVPHVGSV